METIGNIGIQIVLAALYLAVLLIPAYAVDKINDRYTSETKPEGLGCFAQLLIFIIMAAPLYFLLLPAKQALIERNCRSADDYVLCVEGDDYIQTEYDRR